MAWPKPGGSADFEQVYTQYHRTVYSYLLALCHDEQLAADATQDTFCKALRAIDRFHGECPLNVWLCRIAKNTLYSALRKAGRDAPLTDEFAETLPAPAGDAPQAAAESRAGALRIHRALHALPDPYREVFWLRVYGELPFAEIGLPFHKTESWARVTYYRARQKLQELLKEDAP